MIYESDTENAIKILKEICCIIPPMPIKNLSYNTQTLFSKNVGAPPRQTRLGPSFSENKENARLKEMEE